MHAKNTVIPESMCKLTLTPARVAVLTAIVLIASPSLAESRYSSPRTSIQSSQAESACRRESALINSSDLAVQRRQMNLATTCPDAGGELLAAKWRNPPRDSATLDILAASSKRLKDARVTEAALAAASNRSNNRAQRTKALEVLVGQVGVYLTFGPIIQQGEKNLQTGETKMLDMVSASRREGVEFVNGAMPVTAALRSQIVETLRSLELQQDDQYVKLAAKRAREIIQVAK